MIKIKTIVRVRLAKDKIFLGRGVRELLEAIDEHKSIKKATEITGISYPKAMRIISILEEELDFQVVNSSRGGHNRGGTELTVKGRDVLNTYIDIEKQVEEFAEKLVAEKFKF